MNSNIKTFGQNPDLTWSKKSDEWKVNDESHEFLDDQELPNWALKALKSSPEKDYEELYDERALSPPPSDPPMQSPEDHLQQTTNPPYYPYPYVNQQYQHAPSNQNFHEIKGPSSRSHSELSMSVYPSSEMNSSMNQAIRDAYNPPNERSRGYSYAPVNYRSNVIPCSLNNYTRNNNNSNNVHSFQGDAFRNDDKNGYYQNNWDQHMEMLYRHGTITPPMNIYTPGHHLNNYQRYDNNCLSTAYHQPAYHSMQDGLMHSQSRPVMSTQPHQNRMLFPHQQVIHPYQVYHSSVAQGRLPERCIPFSAQYGNNFSSSSSFYNPEMPDHSSLNSSKANISLNSCVQSTKSSEEIHASNLPMQQNSFTAKCQINENNELLSTAFPIHPVVCNDAPKQPDSISSHPTTTATTTQKQGNLVSDVQETLITESKLSKDQSICETGKPNILSATPKESPKSLHKEASKVDTAVSNEKDDRTPVAYTILFSPKDEVAKPPELSDKRFLSRAKSQDRFTSVNKLSEAKKPNTNFNPRNVSARMKAEKIQPENRAPRRSRASVKSTSSETPQPSSSQTLSQSFNESSPREQLFQGRSSKLSQLKKPSTAIKKTVKENSISDCGDCDAVSESGTYVVDSESSFIKTFRDDIPNVFGIDLDDIDDEQYTFKRSFSQKPKVSRHKSSGTSVDLFSQKKKVPEAALENISTSSLSSSDKFSSRRLLPEAPAASNMQEKVSTKKRNPAPLSEKGDIISKWLNKSFLTNKPPPSSTNCFYSTRSGLSNDKDDSLNNRQSRRNERTVLSGNKVPSSQKEIPKRDATPFREISGRRSVDPQTSSVRTRVARMNINSSFGDVDDLNASSQMSKSLVSNYEFAPLMSRPVRPRSTSRPRQSKSVAARKLNDLSSDSLNDSKSGTDLETSTFSKTRPSVSERLCAPTIATELKSKKNLNIGEPAPTMPHQSSLQNGSRNEAPSLRGSRRKIVRSKTLDCEEFLSSESHKTPENKHSDKKETLDFDDDDDDDDDGGDVGNEDKKEVSLKNGEAVEDKTQEINMSQKVAKLTKKYLRDLQELLKDGSDVESREHSAVEEILSHLKDHTFVTNPDDDVLGAVTDLIKSQSSANDDKSSKVLTKKYKETTF